MGYYVKLVAGLALLAASLVAFEVSLVKLLQTGTCASGNTPYAIAQPCPEGTGTWVILLNAGIFGGLIGAGLYAFRGERPGGDLFDPPVGFGMTLWSIFFAGTGLVCLGVRLFSDVPLQAGAKFATIFVGCLFLLMGIVPIVFGIWSAWDDRDSARRKSSNPNLAAATGSGSALGRWAKLGSSGSGMSFGGGDGGGADSLDKLERLEKLRESGALTSSEFESEKAKILGQG